jgi:hypothetical protein
LYVGYRPVRDDAAPTELKVKTNFPIYKYATPNGAGIERRRRGIFVETTQNNPKLRGSDIRLCWGRVAARRNRWCAILQMIGPRPMARPNRFLNHANHSVCNLTGNYSGEPSHTSPSKVGELTNVDQSGVPPPEP